MLGRWSRVKKSASVQLRQVQSNVLGLIKTSVRLRQAEQEEADTSEQAAADREGHFSGALTLFNMLKLMERNKHCHHRSCDDTHTHTEMYKCAHTLPLALANVALSFYRLFFVIKIEGLCHV